MTLYHGSTIDIAKVDLALSKPNKDFGRAFYLSDDRQQALEMAQFRAEFEETEPVVNVYEFDVSLFQEFRYKQGNKQKGHRGTPFFCISGNNSSRSS